MLTVSDVQKVYRKIKDDIAASYRRKEINRTISLIDAYASVVQRINDVFRDDDIEECIESIAKNEVGIAEKPDWGKASDRKRIVFYDQIGTTVCLGVQYIRGLIENGYEILYIYEAPSIPIHNNLLKILQKEDRVKILLVDSAENEIKQIQELRDEIISFDADKLIIHSPAFGAFGAIVLSTIPFITRFRIVPGDHHFYIGYKCIDYFLEFRDFGIQMALNRRDLSLNSLYKLPYYPLIDEGMQFQGFPEEVVGKTILVAAGAEYKFQGSNAFFDVCTHILKEYSNAVVLFIGNASERTYKYIEENALEGRFIPLGYRRDFGACIKHADMLFNSYPVSGGLICQYAAYYSLPILSISNKEHELARSVRGLLGGEGEGTPISFSNMNHFYEYIHTLLVDELFRKEEGKRMKSMLQTKKAFDSSLGRILMHNFPHSNIAKQKIDYNYRVDFYLENQFNFRVDLINPLLNAYGIRFLFVFPSLLSTLIRQKKYVASRILTLYSKKLYAYLPAKLKRFVKK